MTEEAKERSKVALQMQTRSGKMLTPDDLTPENVVLEDISYPLSKLTRYNGHFPSNISVAHHAMLCVAIGKEVFNLDPSTLFEVLHHDDTEAYMGDMPYMMKAMCPAFKELEDHLYATMIAPRFDLPKELSPIVKYIDWLAVAYEKMFVHDSKHNNSLARNIRSIKSHQYAQECVLEYCKDYDTDWELAEGYLEIITAHVESGRFHKTFSMIQRIMDYVPSEENVLRTSKEWEETHDRLVKSIEMSKKIDPIINKILLT